MAKAAKTLIGRALPFPAQRFEAAAQITTTGQRLVQQVAAEIEQSGGQVIEIDTDGVYFVPAFVGLGAPYWQQDVRGLITGLTRGSGPAHIARATLDAIAYQVRDVFAAMQAEAGSSLEFLLADGGASRNDQLMQFQADILGVPVLRSASSDMSALGAAYLAGLAVGSWQSLAEIAALPRKQDRFEPQLEAERRAALVAGWQQAVAKAMHTV